MNNSKRIDKIYNVLKDLCMSQYRNEGIITGIPTKTICEALSIQRTNASSDLNKLHKLGKIHKEKTNPALYKIKKQDLLNEDKIKQDSFFNIIGADLSLKKCIQQAKAAIIYPPNGLHTIIFGETGTGKSLFAEHMYDYAKQIGKLKKDSPFVVFNCADYSNNPQLLMSHLFGVKKGSYTGADKDKQGLVEKSNNGILFLDEIHRLPPEGQEMLFYLIDKGQYRKLGESDELHKVTVQIICATTENIDSSLLKTFIRRIPMIINLPSLKDRTIDERYELLKYFFMVEVATLHSDITVSSDVLTALLFYDCPNNIGQLRSDIKLACAKAYLNNIDNMNDSVIVELEHLSQHIKKNILSYKNNNINKFHTETITFAASASGTNIILDNKSPNLYEILYNKTSILRNKGLSEEDIRLMISLDIELYFKNYMEKIEKNSFDELYKIVDKKIVSIVSDFLKEAEQFLEKKFSNKVLFGLSIHVSSFIERSGTNKFLGNTHLDDIKNNHPKEFQICKKLKESLEKKLKIKVPIDEVGFFSMFLYINDTKEESTQPVGIIVAMHGEAAATSIADVANRLLDETNVIGYNMPLSEKPDIALSNILDLVKNIDKGSGVILLVDMGSLTWFGDMIYENTGITVKVIDMVSTPMVLEASRKALMGASIDEVYDSIVNLSPYIGKVYRQNIELEGIIKKDVIITACITGKGTALKLKSILEKKYNLSNNDIDILPININNQSDFKNKIKKIKKNKNIIAVVSSIDPEEKSVKYISTIDLINGAKIHLLDNEIYLNKSFNTINNMEEILAENVDIDSKKFISRFKEFYSYLLTNDIELDDNKLAGLMLHLACVIERISKGQPLNSRMDRKKFIITHKAKVSNIEHAINSLEIAFNIKLTDEEYYNMAKVIYSL